MKQGSRKTKQFKNPKIGIIEVTQYANSSYEISASKKVNNIIV